MDRKLRDLSRLSNRDRRLLGRAPTDDLICFLVQIAFSTASALARIEAHLESRRSAASQVKEVLDLLAPWTGLILAIILWLIGQASLQDVQQAASEVGTPK